MAIARILAGHALILGWDGIPLLYMGDEIGLLNDWHYLSEPAHADDSRWVHRPPMDWQLAERRMDPGSIPGRIFAGIRRLIEIRAGVPQLHVAAPLRVLDVRDASLFAYQRGTDDAPLLAIHNFSEQPRWLPQCRVMGLLPTGGRDLLSGRQVGPEGSIELGPYQTCWLVRRNDLGMG